MSNTGRAGPRVAMVLERDGTAGTFAAVAPPAVVDARPAAQPSAPAASAPPAPPAVASGPEVTAPPLLTATPTPGPPAETSSDARRTAGYIVGAVGIAVGGAALIHFLWNKDRYDDYQHAMVNDPAKADAIRSASAVSVGLAVGAGALLATGVVLVTW